MNLIANRVRGMQDLLPDCSGKWDLAETVMKEEAALYGFKLLRTPVLERSELFERSVGGTSDIVEKEMYTFEDKGGRRLTLRPEGTASALRAVLENGLHNSTLPVKLMYISSCYRYERPQSGRYREFFQFGLEIFGSESSFADFELICAAKSIISRLGITGLTLEINNIGCPVCRLEYNRALKKYFEERQGDLCSDCISRLSRNPMRILDCKNNNCAGIVEGAPVILDYICEDCTGHFETLKNMLSSAEVAYTVNPKIVRGLDYYDKTVFEFICKTEDGPLTLCGGGRYDGLSEIIGGPNLPAIGFGMGIERILAVMESQNAPFAGIKGADVFVACADDKARSMAFSLCERLRSSSVSAETDITGKKLKSQLKYADKTKIKYCIIVGEEELNTRKAKMKEMKSGQEYEISLDENFLSDFISAELNSK